MAEPTKRELRAAALKARDAMDPDARAAKNRSICEQLAGRLGWCTSGGLTVAVYAAMGSEVDLDAFVRLAFDRGCTIAFPCMMENPRAAVPGQPRALMEFRTVSQRSYQQGGVSFIADPLRTFAAGAIELNPYPACKPASVDLAAVPLVGFDAEGHRLGYGGGNYDRFLPQLREDARTFGVAFAEQELPAVPAEAHDIDLAIISA